MPDWIIARPHAGADFNTNASKHFLCDFELTLEVLLPQVLYNLGKLTKTEEFLRPQATCLPRTDWALQRTMY
ncbi:hypothetical protein CO613_10605 [Lysobacteraceae bacterium NML07-0707]|nr:hypothetical protein CO613_10605 [Xanthomonadaceae bacterium NML07-0707]